MNEHAEWSPPHSHEPHPAPPSDDDTFLLRFGSEIVRLTPDDLRRFPQQTVDNCLIASTGHPASGPFTFGGVALLALIERYVNIEWAIVDVMSDDGFGARLATAELQQAVERPALLALTIDGRPLTRAEGLVRLVVPGEIDDALRQVKWVSDIYVR